MQSVKFKQIDNWEVLTPTGFKPFKGVKRVKKQYSLLFTFENGKTLRCSDSHKIKKDGAEFLYASMLYEGDSIGKGLKIIKREEIEEPIYLYDFIEVEGSEYITEDIFIHHNCAFIDNVEETFAAAQQTLATGGQCIALSSPNGVGNWFHKTWEAAEAGENSFIPIKLPWTVHPERDQTWRDQQDADLGIRLAAQECDADFLTSGDTYFDLDILNYYDETYVIDPVERRGVDSNLWVWESPDYTKSYMVAADVSRGDSSDSSTFHVIEITSCTQVAEYKGKLPPKDFGNLLVGIASEYNGALIVVENASMGWATIEQILEREYPNLFYSSRGNMETVESYMNKYDNDQLVPGFVNSAKTRPLLLAKLQEYMSDKSIIIQSRRTMSEARVFMWKNGKAQAQAGYNDDLIMALAVGMYVRDTALRLRQQGLDLAKAQMSSLSSINSRNTNIYSPTLPQNNPYKMNVGIVEEDLTWLL